MGQIIYEKVEIYAPDRSEENEKIYDEFSMKKKYKATTKKKNNNNDKNKQTSAKCSWPWKNSWNLKLHVWKVHTERQKTGKTCYIEKTKRI